MSEATHVWRGLTGMTSTFLSCRILSAGRVVGPLAPSATTCTTHHITQHPSHFTHHIAPSTHHNTPTLAFIWRATSAVICCSPAAGMRISHGATSRFSSVGVAPGNPTMVSFSCGRRAEVMPHPLSHAARGIYHTHCHMLHEVHTTPTVTCCTRYIPAYNPPVPWGQCPPHS